MKKLNLIQVRKILFKDKGSAVNLLKMINRHNESFYETIIKPSFLNLLNEYNQNPKELWANKIVAINMIFSTVIQNYSSQCR